jgi:hypothetical protein
MPPPNQLWKSTIEIWTDYDPAHVELEDLAREANRGDAFCSGQATELVVDKTKFPVTDFFTDRDADAMTISAEVHSDDQVTTAKFDAAPWFQQASAKDIAALARCGWRGDDAADAVAQYFQGKNSEVDGVFYYVGSIQGIRLKRDCCGFECSVHEKDAMTWLLVHRQDIALALLTGAEADVAEWAALHYKVDINTLYEDEKASWRDRYKIATYDAAEEIEYIWPTAKSFEINVVAVGDLGEIDLGTTQVAAVFQREAEMLALEVLWDARLDATNCSPRFGSRLVDEGADTDHDQPSEESPAP